MRANSTAVHDHFLADHRAIEGLLEGLLAAFGANDREGVQRLWTAFESSLLVHLEAEEKLMIPEFLRHRERDAQALLAEHNHLRARLNALGTGIDLHIVRLEAARAFIEDLRAHARREDALYAWADCHLAKQPRASLLGALTRAVRAVVGAVSDAA